MEALYDTKYQRDLYVRFTNLTIPYHRFLYRYTLPTSKLLYTTKEIQLGIKLCLHLLNDG